MVEMMCPISLYLFIYFYLLWLFCFSKPKSRVELRLQSTCHPKIAKSCVMLQIFLLNIAVNLSTLLQGDCLLLTIIPQMHSLHI